MVLFIVSCSKNDKKVRISVTTSDFSVKNIKVNLTNMLNLTDTLLSEANFDSLGEAKLEFKLSNPMFASIELGKKWIGLYLEPGYNLKLVADQITDNSISFSGKGAEPNNYIFQVNKIYRGYEFKGGKYLWELTPNQYVTRLDSLLIETKNFHIRYCDSTNMEKKLCQILELNDRLYLISQKMNYLLSHHLDKSSGEVVPEQLLGTVKEIPLDDDLLKYQMFSYAIALKMYFNWEEWTPFWRSEKGNNDPININDRIEKDIRFPAGIKEHFIATNIVHQMQWDGKFTSVIDSLVNNFKHKYPLSNYLPQLQLNAGKLRAIAPGSIAPDLTGITIDGKSISLKDLRGKVVYIDVWATWCGPCRNEFPFSKKLEKQFDKNEKVVFLYFSIDQTKDVEIWKKWVTNHISQNGIHLIQPVEQMLEPYRINGIPWYILIDTEGKIVNSDAPKPSSGKVESEILKLLEK